MRLALLIAIAIVGPAAANAQQYAIEPDGGASVQASYHNQIFQASTWEPLDAAARAELYVGAAGTGLLGQELRACARLIQPAAFAYDGMVVRGAAAVEELSPSILCSIGDGAILSLATVKAMLSSSLGELDPLLSREIEGLEALVTSPAEERSLLAVLFIREAGRASSPLMPYMQALLVPTQGLQPHTGAQKKLVAACLAPISSMR